MKARRVLLRFFLPLWIALVPAALLPAKQYAIVKADDFIVQADTPSKAVSEPYLKFIAMVREKKIVAGLGLIVKTLEHATPEFITLCRELDASGRFEIWNHGYDHAYNFTDENGAFVAAEFFNMPYSYQRDQMKKAQDGAKKMLGITFHSFGSPGNRDDATTALMLAKFPEITVWFYPPRGVLLPPGVIGLSRTNAEWNGPKGRHVDSARFIKEYDPAKPVICFQLHPRSKTDAELAEVGRIIDFLLSQGVEFIKPYDYYLLIKSAAPATPAPGSIQP